MSDDASACAEWMRPRIQMLLEGGLTREQLLRVCEVAFEQLLHNRDYTQKWRMIESAKKEFTVDAILVSLLGLVVNLYMMLGLPHETAKESMAARLNGRIK